MKKAYSFDDVTLVPKYSTINSRLDVQLDTKLTKNIWIKMPIIASNMESVIDVDLAKVLINNGSVPIFHRFTTYEQKKKWVEEFPDCFISCGIKPEEQDEILKLAAETNLTRVCIDVAHAHCFRVLKLIEILRDENLEVMVGSVCTKQAIDDLTWAGAHAALVGIGVGSVCTTTDVTGFGLPQFSTIQECAEDAQIPIIANGGIRNSRDIVLALAAGASTVMMGRPFARAVECAGNTSEGHKDHYSRDLQPYSLYRGQASKSFQNDILGGVKEGTVPEGKEESVSIHTTAQELIDELLGGVRSGFTYGGASNIMELQNDAEFRAYTRKKLW